MSTVRLKWHGNLEAQRLADAAYAKLLTSQEKRRKKGPPKKKQRGKHYTAPCLKELDDPITREFLSLNF